MIHLKKERFGKIEAVIKITETKELHFYDNEATVDNGEDRLGKEWYEEHGYIDATREEFDEFLKPVVNEINQITKE